MCLFRVFWSQRGVCFWNNLSNRFLYLLWFKTNSDMGIYIMKSLSFISDQYHFILGSFTFFTEQKLQLHFNSNVLGWYFEAICFD